MKHTRRMLEKVLASTQLITFLAIGIIAVIAGCTTAPVTAPTGQVSPPHLTKVSVALDWFPWSGQAGLWVAQEKGYFADEGLDVELNVPSDPATILQTVASGRDDFGISYAPDVFLARDKEIPVVSVIGLVQHPLYSLMSLESSNIEQPNDFAGKKIGHSGLAFNEIVIDTMLKFGGKSLKDVELVNLGFDLVPALITKKVDGILAYWVVESISAENQGFPVDLMRAEEYGVPDYYELTIVTNEGKVAQNKDLVQRFVRATMRGYEDAIADPQGAVLLMKQARPEVDLSVDSKGVDLLVPLWKSDNGIFGWQDEKRWIDFAQWMKDNDLLSEDVDAAKAFDNSFVANAGKQK